MIFPLSPGSIFAASAPGSRFRTTVSDPPAHGKCHVGATSAFKGRYREIGENRIEK